MLHAVLRILLVFAIVVSSAPRALATPPEREFLGAAATVHPQATQAALDTFRQGGNAIDAAVSAALVLNVVNGYNSGLGGGCFVLIRLSDGRLIAIDGREAAPAAATREMFLRDGKADPKLSQFGPLASGVPGALAAYDLAVRDHGRLPLSDPLLRAADVAEAGFIVDAGYARVLTAQADELRAFPATRAVLLRADGSPHRPGDLLKQPDLARSFRAIAERGTEWFYRGDFAARCAEWMRDNGGLLTTDDFAAYRARQRQPIVSTYRAFTIVGFPPPSSGGIHVAQMLNVLEHFDLAAMEEPQRIHVIAETMKLAFADRAHWLGDADFADVPRGLIDKRYAAELAKRISLDRAGDVAGHGTPPGADSDFFRERHTTHLTTVDAEGNWVALTATVNTHFGSKVIIPGTGIVMNNEMDDFAAQPGVPNAFGLLGAEANAVEAGKRPLSSMSPTIVLQDGRPVFTCGGAGGPKIITQVLCTLVRRLDLELSPQECLSSPRFHHQWRPDALQLERSAPEAWQQSLKQQGHTVELTGPIAVCQCIGVSKSGEILPAADPHQPSAAGIAWRVKE